MVWVPLKNLAAEALRIQNPVTHINLAKKWTWQLDSLIYLLLRPPRRGIRQMEV
jgi:hypothetical protein